MNFKDIFNRIVTNERRLKDIERRFRGRRKHQHFGRTPKGTKPNVRTLPKMKGRYRKAGR